MIASSVQYYLLLFKQPINPLDQSNVVVDQSIAKPGTEYDDLFCNYPTFYSLTRFLSTRTKSGGVEKHIIFVSVQELTEFTGTRQNSYADFITFQFRSLFCV